MNEIDWSKAPEWATRLMANKGCAPNCWCDDLGKGVWTTDEHDNVFDIIPLMWVEIARRPSSPAWNGEGLPPVGARIEWFSPIYGWLGGRVVGHDGSATVVVHNDGYTGCHPHEVRPIRTPEQIAAEEREKAITAMTDIGRNGDGGYFGFCAALYDAGYRKTEAPK